MKNRITVALTVGLCLALPTALQASSSIEGLPLSSISEVHGMHRKEAAFEIPVKVRGTVTYGREDGPHSFVLEDGQAGIYVSGVDELGSHPSLSPGTLVEVIGVTDPGGYAPLVTAHDVEIIGRADLPPAKPVTVSQLLTGRFDSRRVEVRGVVQDAESRGQPGQFRLEVAGEFGRILVFARRGDVAPAALIDADVVVRGVCFPFFNERSQVAGVRIMVNNTREVEVVRPPRDDPFSAPRVELDELQAFSLEGVGYHRQQLRGIVTLSAPGFIYVQGGTHGVRVNLAEELALQPGDRIEAVGFPQAKTRFVEWQRALVRKIGTGPAPQAIPTTRDQALRLLAPQDDRSKGDYDGRLVSLTGRLEQTEAVESGGWQLFVECGGHIVTTVLVKPDQTGTIGALRLGSRVRVTGVCQIEYEEDWPALTGVRPATMKLLLRSPDDVAVLKMASWWTTTRLRIALGVLGALLLASLPWMRSLRRQVGERTKELASETRARQDAEVEFRATLRERERVAADMHDTVEQALTGVSYQLAVVDALHEKEPSRSRQHLTLANQLLEQSREDVRRSVLNLRSQALKGRPLAEVLRDVAAGLSARHSVKTEVRVTGEDRHIPEHTAGHLLLLAQEAMTNAIKHANPVTISLTLSYGEDSAELSVRDDGAGFDPDEAPGMAEGHLGLQGMHERMKRLNGELQIESRPGKGTEIRATVPLR